MRTLFGRLGDRLLTHFLPARSAQAVNCECRCTDKCYPCCPQVVEGTTIIVCHPEKDCRP